jgi:hypothetical protein
MKTAPGTLEVRVSLLILLVLLAVGAGVFVKQYSFNRAVLVARQLAAGQPAGAASAGAPSWLPAELREFGPPESFTPDNLYDKIDGKAELYLAAGFVQMNCQLFALKSASDQWLEWFVYDMGTFPHAFSVFSTQRRSEGQALPVAEFAYRTQNAVFFVCGGNYVEAVASSADPALMQAVAGMASRFVAANPGGTARLPELAALPTEDLEPGSYTLQSSDAFGFDQFKNVFTAQYKLGGAELTAFVMSCPGTAEAAASRDAYRAFLLANGGKETNSAGADAAGKPIEIMGSFEFVFSSGKLVAGVHAAPELAPGGQLAARLRERIEQPPGAAGEAK